MTEATTSRTRSLTLTALSTALLCIFGPISIPIGPIPISVTNFMLFLMLYLLGWRRTISSFGIYLMLGIAGLPVFSGYAGGIAKLLGPTGGYLIGFLPMLLLAGTAIERSNRRIAQIFALSAATLVCYTFGTIWFCIQSGNAIAAALSLCVIPFIPFDLAKILAVSAIGPMMKKLLNRAA